MAEFRRANGTERERDEKEDDLLLAEEGPDIDDLTGLAGELERRGDGSNGGHG
jgi:hypothetical protein